MTTLLTLAEIRACAERMGLTRLVNVDAGGADLNLAVAEDTDFDGRFQALCLETGDVLSVNGWNCYLHDDADGRAQMAAQYWDWRD